MISHLIRRLFCFLALGYEATGRAKGVTPNERKPAGVFAAAREAERREAEFESQRPSPKDVTHIK